MDRDVTLTGLDSLGGEAVEEQRSWLVPHIATSIVDGASDFLTFTDGQEMYDSFYRDVFYPLKWKADAFKPDPYSSDLLSRVAFEARMLLSYFTVLHECLGELESSAGSDRFAIIKAGKGFVSKYRIYAAILLQRFWRRTRSREGRGRFAVALFSGVTFGVRKEFLHRLFRLYRSLT